MRSGWDQDGFEKSLDHSQSICMALKWAEGFKLVLNIYIPKSLLAVLHSEIQPQDEYLLQKGSMILGSDHLRLEFLEL